MTKKPRKKRKASYIASVMGPKAVDIYVGQRLRERRTIVGMSQTVLAENVGLTFQQIQKYEKGMNRISASRVYEFSTILRVSPSWFFEGYKENAKPRTDDELVLCKRETLEFVRSYDRIPEEEQKQLRALIMAASKAYMKK